MAAFFGELNAYFKTDQRLIWVTTPEPLETMIELTRIAHRKCDTHMFFTFSISHGMQHYAVDGDRGGWVTTGASDGPQGSHWSPPLSFEDVIAAWSKLLLRAAGKNVVLILQNGDYLLEQPVSHQTLLGYIREIGLAAAAVQYDASTANSYRGTQQVQKMFTYLTLHNTATLPPPSLAAAAAVVEYPLPEQSELLQLLSDLCQGRDPSPIPDDPRELELLLSAASGLTRNEAERTFALSIAKQPKDSKINPDLLMELKAKTIAQACPSLRVVKPAISFKQVGGAAALKRHMKVVSEHLTSKDELRRPKGLMLFGLPGTGKSAFIKASASLLGVPLVNVDLSANYGMYVGQSEAGMRQMLMRLDQIQPSIAFIDEIDKAVGGDNDSSVRTGMLGQLLTWMQDHTSAVYVVSSANKLDAILKHKPELLRAGRYDDIFFFDYPTWPVRKRIWGIHLRRFGLIGPDVEITDELLDSLKLPDDRFWTGAEIEQCCKKADVFKLPLAEAGERIPISYKQANAANELLRQEASNRGFLDPQTGEAYNRERQTQLIQDDQRFARRVVTTKPGAASRRIDQDDEPADEETTPRPKPKPKKSKKKRTV